MTKSKPTIKCIACSAVATVKDYRTRNEITDGYPVCDDHFAMDDVAFWKEADANSERLMARRGGK